MPVQFYSFGILKWIQMELDALDKKQDQVDSVEYYALQATEHVGSGGTELLKGTVSRTKARKKKLGLIVCLAAGFGIVLLVLVLT